LDRNGLAFALQELAVDTEQLFNISCTFVCEDNVSVGSVSVASNLYRIAQEAITNAVKHGKTQNVRVELTADNDSVMLRVENDGLDFSEQTDKGKGMGLSIMRYRAEMIDGSLDIGRRAGGGTCITCLIANVARAEQSGE
jgi:signal transduction histidine kinase